jgi:hypothetical protein
LSLAENVQFIPKDGCALEVIRLDNPAKSAKSAKSAKGQNGNNIPH